jgi:hypothetical protein
MIVRRQVELNEQRRRAQSEEPRAKSKAKDSDFIFLVSGLASRVSGWL